MFDWFKRGGKGARPPKFPFPLETVRGSDAFATFERLKRAGTGSPVILGDDKALEMIVDIIGYGRHKGETAESILRLAERNPFLAGLRADIAEVVRKIKERDPTWIEEEDDLDPHGGWPEEIPDAMVGPAVALDIGSGAPLERVHVALIPTQDTTAIAAYLQWGGWNACPAPQHHVAAARAWRECYGAELVSMAGDVVEYRVARRPKDREEALALAREHVEYCSEIDDIYAHAASLMVSDWWFFWWD